MVSLIRCPRGLLTGYTGILTKPIRQATLLEALAAYASSDRELSAKAGRRGAGSGPQALADADFAALQNSGRKLKGIGAAIEHAATAGDKSQLRVKVAELSTHVDSGVLKLVVGIRYPIAGRHAEAVKLE